MEIFKDFIRCKILVGQMSNIKNAQPNFRWVNGGFYENDVSTYYDYLEKGKKLGTVLILKNGKQLTTDLISK